MPLIAQDSTFNQNIQAGGSNDAAASEFMANISPEILAEIEMRKEEAKLKRNELESQWRENPDAAQALLDQYYADALAKRDEILQNLPDEVRNRIEKRLVEIQEKVETRNPSLEEDLNNQP